MNPYAAAAQVATTPQEGNPRATEAWALTEAGRRLAAASRGEARIMREALRLNWRLWTIFQADLTVSLEADPTNDLVINMLTLCQFVDRHTVDALGEPTSEKLDVLVGLNRQIAAGLNESLDREVGVPDAVAQSAAQQAAAQQSAAQSPSAPAPRAPLPYSSQHQKPSAHEQSSMIPPGSFNAIA